MLTKIIILVSILSFSSLCWAQPSDPYKSNCEALFPVWENRPNPKPGCFCATTGVACNTWAGSYAILNNYTTANYSINIPGVGSFGPKPVGIEYSRVILGADGTDCNSPFILRYQDLGRSTWKWTPDNQCITHGAILNLTIDYTAFGGPRLPLDGLFIKTTVCFDPSYAPVANVSSYTSIPDEVQLKGLASNAGAVSALQVCTLIMSACPANSSLKQYENISDCLAYMATKPTVYGVCPTSQDSDTVNCRFLHAMVASLPPTAPGEPNPATIHCPHTGKNSMTCINRCLPACSGCTSNQHCINTVNDPVNPVYGCVCNTGYGKASDGSCQPKSCNYNYECTSEITGNVAVCDSTSHLCNCTKTFHWNPTNGTCSCPSSDHFVSWSTSGDNPSCIPIGRCYEKYECQVPGSNANTYWNQVNCVQYGTNPNAPYKTCVCNPGYDGGFQYPCVCPSPGTEVWSSQINANVCAQLSNGQCTADYHCTSPQTCKNVSYTTPIGTCGV